MLFRHTSVILLILLVTVQLVRAESPEEFSQLFWQWVHWLMHTANARREAFLQDIVVYTFHNDPLGFNMFSGYKHGTSFIQRLRFTAALMNVTIGIDGNKGSKTREIKVRAPRACAQYSVYCVIMMFCYGTYNYPPEVTHDDGVTGYVPPIYPGHPVPNFDLEDFLLVLTFCQNLRNGFDLQYHAQHPPAPWVVDKSVKNPWATARPALPAPSSSSAPGSSTDPLPHTSPAASGVVEEVPALLATTRCSQVPGSAPAPAPVTTDASSTSTPITISTIATTVITGYQRYLG